MKRLTVLICFLLLAATAINLVGCAASGKGTVTTLPGDLMANITPAEYSGENGIRKEDSESAADFAVRLFKECNESGKDILVSPLSVLCALAMTSNGAKGETLSQMESTLGMNTERLNRFIYNYLKALPATDDYKLKLANSIWFTDDKRFTVNGGFLQINADYYGADIYKAHFDRTTCDNINNWVKDKTDGMIPKILDEIPEEALMYLVNALAFEAKWETEYDNSQVSFHSFTNEKGGQRNVSFMFGTEGKYLESEDATGFIKHYKGGKYAFAALLPNEGISIDDYVSSLTGEKLLGLLSSAKAESVDTAIPKFKLGYDADLSNVLSKMGMSVAFDHAAADFSGLGNSTGGNVAIDRVLHKTFISVAEQGTKAGAATVVEVTDECAPMIGKSVYLDRPFVYMLIDTETGIPFFIGTLTTFDGLYQAKI